MHQPGVKPPAHLSAEEFKVEGFQQRLLSWFEQNMRDLPWRQDRDPYKIWVSEVMLQQTQVETVIPYYQRFMKRFPTIDALAAADEEEVLKYWEGLGYYSRARHLHQAVKEVQAKYGGEIPETKEELLSLKGVGRYTTGAILSIAFGQRVPAVDGNVLRVISRIFLIREEIEKAAVQRRVEQIVQGLIPEERASYFNQALMELGALICLPRTPQCHRCPVQPYCRAFQQGVQGELPIKKKKKKPRTVRLAAGILFYQESVLIRRRPDDGLLAKMYEFPAVEWEHSPAETLTQYLAHIYGLHTEAMEEWLRVDHVFSHLKWEITVFHLRFRQQPESPLTSPLLPLETDHGEQPLFWTQADQLSQLPFSVSHQKIKLEVEARINAYF